MGLSFLQQLLMVAGLAFTSGLLAGVAVLRGELGDLRGAPSAAPRPGVRRRKRLAPAWGEMIKSAATAVGELDPALKWVLISLILMLSASAIITRLVE
jgi:hypothetical protein